MSQVQHSNNKRVVVEGRPHQVIKSVPVHIEGFHFTNGTSEVNFALALFFGTNPKTGEENCIIINPQQIQALANIPDPHILEGLLKLRKARKQAPAELPESQLGMVDLKEA